MISLRRFCSLETSLLMALFAFNLWLFWPGIMTGDSTFQLEMARSAVYGDHHPPLMSVVWRYLDMIYPGPALMLSLHLLLLYGAAYRLMQTFSAWQARGWYLLLPIFPHIAVYSGYIWKDVGFAFSFLFVAAHLIALSAKKEQITFKDFALLLPILFYGTAVKFQGQYCAPVMLLWIAQLWSGPERHFKKTFLTWILLMIPFYTVLKISDYVLVTPTQRTNSWHYVKMYDLAALSVATNTCLLPACTLTPDFSMEKLHSTFKHTKVDILLGVVIHHVSKPEELNEVLSAWQTNVIKHPYYYLRHRLRHMAYLLGHVPSSRFFEQAVGEIFSPETKLYTLFLNTLKGVSFLILSHFLILLFSLFYFIASLVIRHSWASQALFFLSSTSLVMIFMLIFFSMEATPRYTYIAACLMSAAHPLAHLSFKRGRTQ